MSSHADKGKEVEVANKIFKRLRKGTKGSSSLTAKAPHARRFGAKAVELYGLKWFNAQKELSMLQKTGLMRLASHLSFLPSATLFRSWGYVFAEPEECKLTL
ncbi:hypothetical protein HAX54_033650, partial [Datura stramonium]|nr:hypothetical protein [Datura stramonium]